MSVSRHGIHDIPGYIRQTRDLIGMSQAQFAQAMGVSAQTVYFWENNKRTPPPLALEWCVALRTALEQAQQRKQEPQVDWGAVLLAGGLSAVLAGILVGLAAAGLSGLLKK